MNLFRFHGLVLCRIDLILLNGGMLEQGGGDVKYMALSLTFFTVKQCHSKKTYQPTDWA